MAVVDDNFSYTFLKTSISVTFLECNIQITTMEIYTPREVQELHKNYSETGPAIVEYTEDTKLCEQAWNMLYRPEIPYVYFNCDPYYEQKVLIYYVII